MAIFPLHAAGRIDLPSTYRSAMKKGSTPIPMKNVSRYILRYAHVTGVCEEEQIAYEVWWTKGDR